VRRAAIALVLLTAGCAHPRPPLDTPTFSPAPVLYIRESLPADARICVVTNPWNNGTPACLTVGDLRALLRHRGDVALGVSR